MNTVWKRWEPAEVMAGKYDIDTLHLDNQGLILTLDLIESSQPHRIQMSFIPFNGIYRETNESLKAGIFGTLTEQYSSNFYGNWSFFIITHSLDNNQTATSSATTNNFSKPYIHFCIMGYDSVIDIFASDYPMIKII